MYRSTGTGKADVDGCGEWASLIGNADVEATGVVESCRAAPECCEVFWTSAADP